MNITSICLLVVGIIAMLYSSSYKEKWENISPEKAITGRAVLFMGGIMTIYCAICSLVLAQKH